MARRTAHTNSQRLADLLTDHAAEGEASVCEKYGLTKERVQELVAWFVAHTEKRVSLGMSRVRFLPNSVGGRVAVEFVEVNDKVAKFWNDNIQRTIAQDKCRPDRRWRWRSIAGLAWRPGPYTVAAIAGQEPAAYALGVKHVGTDMIERFIPCTMLMLVAKYRALPEPEKGATFLWYLADAPASALAKHLPEEKIPKRIGLAGVDFGVTEAFISKHRGYLGLHASADGCPQHAKRLVEWYTNDCSMLNLPPNIDLTGMRRLLAPNDGRYFYHDTARASLFQLELDEYR